MMLCDASATYSGCINYPWELLLTMIMDSLPLHVNQSRTCSYVPDARATTESRTVLPCERKLMHHVSNSWQILKWEKNNDVSFVITIHIFLLNKRFWTGQHFPSPFKESYFTISHSFPTIELFNHSTITFYWMSIIKGCWEIYLCFRSSPNETGSLSSMIHSSSKCRDNLCSSFPIILLTNRQQTKLTGKITD